VVFHNKPLKAPPFNVILERNVEVLCLPPATHLQTCTTNELVLPPSHPEPTMIQILLEAKMGKNSEVGLAQMHKDRNLQDIIGIQMGQIQIVKIKKTVEEGRNGKSKAANKKRNIDDGLMGMFCRNSNPTTNPPRAELFWRKNSNINKTEKI
jgi:hypothetical protein